MGKQGLHTYLGREARCWGSLGDPSPWLPRPVQASLLPVQWEIFIHSHSTYSSVWEADPCAERAQPAWGGGWELFQEQEAG